MEFHAICGDAWKGTQVKAPNTTPERNRVGRWSRATVGWTAWCRLGYVLHDETLIRKARARLDPIVDGVNRGGASFIYCEHQPAAGFNSWAHSQMGRA